MRDALILVVLVVATIWALRRPWIGVMSWTLVSLMSPHTQFGYSAAAWPVAIGVALTTLFGLLITKQRQNPMVGPGPWCLLGFCIWICVTLPFSMYFSESYPLWERSIKIFLMIFVTLALIDDKKKLNVFVWVIVISIGYYGVKGGVFTILTGGNHRVWGPGGFIEGNNEVALAVITTIPLMRYLQTQMTSRVASLAMTIAMGLCVVTVLGTYSRGALFGLAFMGGFFWLKGSRKLVWGILIIAMTLAGLSLMPDPWWERMETIRMYQSDASALGRINAWWLAFNVAKDRLFGGGFMIWSAPVFLRYAPVPDDVHAAHSIYFQVLGEHGFIGLFLFLSIGVSTWLSALRLAKAAQNRPELRWARELGAMAQVSMIAYAVSGAFLSLAYYDLPYDVMIVVTLALRFVRAEQAQTSPITPTTPTPAQQLSQRMSRAR
jgi:probable O-glycosylation ligase (exosortase A-associated)